MVYNVFNGRRFHKMIILCIVAFLSCSLVFSEELLANDKTTPYLQLPSLTLNNDTITMLLHRDILPYIHKKEQHRENRVITAGKLNNNFVFTLLFDFDLNIEVNEVNNLMGFLLIDSVYILISKSLESHIKKFSSNQYSVPVILKEPTEDKSFIDVVISDPPEWWYKIENGKIIPGIYNPKIKQSLVK